MAEVAETRFGLDGKVTFELSDGSLKTVDLANLGGAAGAGVTNLTVTRDSTTVTVVSDTGNDAILTEATPVVAGIMSAAQAAKLDTQPNSPVLSVAGKTGVVNLTGADVGLGSVNNTSDTAKPISTAQQLALNQKQNTLTGTADVPGLTTALAGKQPSLTTYTEVPGLTVALNAKQATLTGVSDVPNLQAALDQKQGLIAAGTGKLLAAGATNGAAPVQITLGTNLSLSGNTLNATGGGSTTTIVNDLSTGGTTSALSAEMGKTLNTALAGKQGSIPAGPGTILGGPATSGANPTVLTLGTNLFLSGTTLFATGGTAAAGQLTAVPMSAPVNVTANNTKSTSFIIPAGSLGKNGSIRIFGTIEKAGAAESVTINMRTGTVGQAFSGMAPTIGQVNNTGAAGVFAFDVMITGNGVDTTSVVGITPAVGFPGSSSTKVAYTVDTATTAFEVAIGGNPGATTATWKVLNAQCHIVNPDAVQAGGTPTVLPWQTVTPNADGTTAVTIDAALGSNVTLNAPVNGSQVINVPSNLQDGAEMQINLVGGGGSGFWTAWSSSTPSTTGWYFPDGLAPLATATNSEILPIYVKRRGAKYVALLGTAEAA